MRRVVNAFVAGEADPSMSPTRRLAGAGFASVMVAVLVVAVFGVIGLLKKGGNTSWQSNGVVVIEKETGTRYVYRDGVLYPVANYASAVLVIGQPVTTVSVSRESLVGATRGPLIGIPGAPDALPPAGRMLKTPWSVCAQNARDGSGGTTVVSTVLVGASPAGGTPLDKSAVLVRDVAGSKVYLLWNGHRFHVPTRVQLGAMGIDGQPSVLVDGAWLDTVPLGLPVQQPTVEGRGQQSTALKNFLVGQVLSVTGGGTTSYYLVRANDILPVTTVEQALILADSATAAAYPGGRPSVTEVSPAEMAQVTKARRQAASDLDPPAEVPAMVPVPADAAICSTFDNGATAPKFVVNTEPLPVGAGIATGGSSAQEVADRVLVEPGHGAIVRSAPSAQEGTGTVFFVTDQGKRYPLPSPAQLAWFGYGAIQPVVMPSYVVARIPTGPGLDPQAAQRPLAG
ncbi:type VII secretion protein EccB [Dactylosporangium roseum]